MADRAKRVRVDMRLPEDLLADVDAEVDRRNGRREEGAGKVTRTSLAEEGYRLVLDGHATAPEPKPRPVKRAPKPRAKPEPKAAPDNGKGRVTLRQLSQATSLRREKITPRPKGAKGK